MGFLKKNLVFCVIVLVCLLAFIAGAFLASGQMSSIDQAKREVASAESQLNNLRFADPAPTEANVEASRENVAELKAVLGSIRSNLQRGARLTVSSDGIGVMAAIQQYISEYRDKAADHTDDNGESDPIVLPEDFAFGFEQYLDRAQSLDDPERSAILDKQRQILSYLLDKLIAADPDSIVSVKREVLERDVTGETRESGFRISPAISARVPGAIDTLAFSLTFTGYTNSLREFLNSMAKFDLPIVVRSVGVTRPTGSRIESTEATTAPSNSIDAIFGAFGGGEEETAQPEEPREAQKPVISENTSTFTVVLEFIEIVLPADSADENI